MCDSGQLSFLVCLVTLVTRRSASRRWPQDSCSHGISQHNQVNLWKKNKPASWVCLSTVFHLDFAHDEQKLWKFSLKTSLQRREEVGVAPSSVDSGRWERSAVPAGGKAVHTGDLPARAPLCTQVIYRLVYHVLYSSPAFPANYRVGFQKVLWVSIRNPLTGYDCPLI